MKTLRSIIKKEYILSKRLLRKLSGSHEHTGRVSKGKYSLTTKARRAVVGRNKKLDEGASRQTWKYLDLLNCVSSVAFKKHDTWVQIWTWHLRGTYANSAGPLIRGNHNGSNC